MERVYYYYDYDNSENYFYTVIIIITAIIIIFSVYLAMEPSGNLDEGSLRQHFILEF